MELLIILLLILLNGVFAMSEIAIVSARKAKLEIEAKKGDKPSQLALEIAESPNRFLSTVQIGITLIGILNGVFGGASITEDIQAFLNGYPLAQPYSESIAVGVVVLIITYFSLVLGELIPKRIGLAYAESIARIVAQPMNILSRVTAPFIWLLGSSSTLILNLFRIRTDQETPITEEEIRALVVEGTTHGSIEEIEQDIVERVFNLGDKKIGSLMTPRQDIVWLDILDEFSELKTKIIQGKHAVFLVCENQLDQVLGIVYVKDLLPAYLENQVIDLASYIKPVLFVPEISKAYDVLEKFKANKIHFGAVLDEYGVVIGIVTMNDIVNSIVGGISTANEFEYEIKKREDDSYLIDGQLPFDEFLDRFNIEKVDTEAYEGFHTLAGFILNQLKHIPTTGEQFKFDNFKFEIIDMDGHRIDKVLVKIDKGNS
ncbi:HlyC/CorC family transporter [Rhodocytophaga rosea]|uniref:HlyC/CorC family transporter n=1 Tax=Rhodocytophaga rosea TaxID=2704465 RepID=A0A6C0GIJ2_9BACT|nr:hemolysin family protein [Rhodocytophaga rosea]QHT67654.1 HlyC/CorC family transporter [Rhodocytophaga rosea]